MGIVGGDLAEEAEKMEHEAKCQGGKVAHYGVACRAVEKTRKAGKNMYRRKSYRRWLDSACPEMEAFEAFGGLGHSATRSSQAFRQRDLRHVAQICIAMHQTFLGPGTTPNGRTVCAQVPDQTGVCLEFI